MGGEETPYEAREAKTEPAPGDVSTGERGSTRALLEAGLQCQKNFKNFCRVCWCGSPLCSSRCPATSAGYRSGISNASDRRIHRDLAE